MIRDLSATLEAVLTDPALTADFPELAGSTVTFERPTDTFSPSSTSLDLFLFDIRENLELRTNEPQVERIGREVVVRQPPRRIDCSYLVTAWPVGGPDLPLQEHRLLGQALALLGRHPTIPPPLLQGSLAGQEPPLPIVVPEIDGLKSPAEFWTAMGAKLRASLSVTVTISVPAVPPVTGPMVTTLEHHFGASGPARAIHESSFAIGGRVLDPDGSGIPGAVVDVTDAGLRTFADDDGRYRFARVPAGTRSLRATAAGFQPATRSADVPGRPEDYELTLTPSP